MKGNVPLVISVSRRPSSSMGVTPLKNTTTPKNGPCMLPESLETMETRVALDWWKAPYHKQPKFTMNRRSEKFKAVLGNLAVQPEKVLTSVVIWRAPKCNSRDGAFYSWMLVTWVPISLLAYNN